MYKEVCFDIIGVCNAKCKYCVNGGNSISGHIHRKLGGGGIEPHEFEKAIQYMLNSDLIGRETLLHLFNWAEPFLHPKIRDIISVLNNYNVLFAISTNASHPVFFEAQYLKNLRLVTLSMSGFSQASYDRIHGFNFEKIKDNIINMVNHYRNNGFIGHFQIAYHIYQFNWIEIFNAKRFADSLKIGINFSAAYLNGYSMFRDYLSNDMGYNTLKNSSSELITYYYNDFISQRPQNYMCPQFEKLTLNEYCEVLVCCSVDRLCRNYSIGKLFDLSADEIKSRKLSQPICQECGKLGIDYLGHNPLMVSVAG